MMRYGMCEAFMRFKAVVILLSLLFCLSLSADGHNLPDSVSLDDLKRRVAGLLIVGFKGTEIDSDSEVAYNLARLGVGGVILFDEDLTAGGKGKRNVESPEQLKKLVADLKRCAGGRKILVGVDQEGGKVNRLKPEYGFPPTVSAMRLGQLDDVDSTYCYAYELAFVLKDCGINFNLAPCVDVNVNDSCPVIALKERSFSAEPDKVTEHAKAYIKAHHDNGIITAIKHFPAHGSSAGDSHVGLTDVTGTWSAKELVPFKKLLSSGAADVVMTAHVFNAEIDDAYPATLSAKTIDGLLRQQLGWRGVVLTDDIFMDAIMKNYSVEQAFELALNAGIDMFMLGNNSPSGYKDGCAKLVVDTIVQLVLDGKVCYGRIQEASERVAELIGRAAR